MNLWQRLYRGETHIDFMALRRRAAIISGVLLAVSLLALVVRGLNLGVDFDGGTVVEAENVAEASVSEVRSAVEPLGLDDVQVQLLGAGGTRIRVQTATIEDPAASAELVQAVADVAGVAPTDTNLEAVGPTFGAEIARSAVRALAVFLVVVSIFIAIRFEWKMALAALVALAHDLILTSGVYAVTGFEVTPATVIAILTILGYSLYDTVVVFDKVTENVALMEERYAYGEIVNTSMNSVLMRSINTSLTSLLPIGSLLFVGSFLLGATTLREFALALFVGVAAGTYSSIFVAAPLLATLKATEPEWLEAAERSRRRSKGEGTAVPPPPRLVTAKARGTKPGEAPARAPKRSRERAERSEKRKTAGDTGAAEARSKRQPGSKERAEPEHKTRSRQKTTQRAQPQPEGTGGPAPAGADQTKDDKGGARPSGAPARPPRKRGKRN